MYDQDHRKIHLPGHESHRVYLCHKCGWPFPNQHPSSRQRRAHKRVCGTLEGYKLLEAKGAIHSDDEHLSDDDRKTLFVERDVKENGTVRIAEGSTRQGDEKSLETGRELVENLEKISGNDPENEQSSKNNTITGHLDDSSIMKKPEIPESITILPGTILKSEDHISGSTISVPTCSLSDIGKEESAGNVSDDRSSACGLKLIGSGTPRDVSQDSDNLGADVDTADCSMPYLEVETNAKEKGQINLDGNYPDDLVSLADNAGETSTTVPVVQKTEEIISDFGLADEILKLKERTDGSDTKMSISELSHKVDHVALGGSSIDVTQIKDVVQGVDFASYGHSSKDSNGKEDDNDDVFVLSLPDDITIVDQAESMTRGLRVMSSHQYLNLDTCEMITDTKDDAIYSVPKSEFTDVQSRDFNQSSKLSASEVSVFEKGPKQQCSNSKLIVEEVHVEKEDDGLQMKVTTNEAKVSDDLESGVDAMVTDRQKVQEAHSPEDKNPHDYCNREKAIEKSDIDTDNNIRTVGKEDHTGSRIITESATDFNKWQANIESNFVSSDHVPDEQKGEILKVDGREGDFVLTSEENVPLKAEVTPISPHEYQVVPDDVLDVSRMNLNEDGSHLSEAKGEIRVEWVGGISATKSHEVVDAELLQRGKGQMTKEQPILPLDADSSVQNATAVADNCDRDFGGCAGDFHIQSESLSGQCVDNFVKKKFGTCIPHVSIDSSSQNDSLEGHWGSVSVLSTPSDITAITETGPFTSTDSRASAEAGNASLKNLQVTSEGQRSDKSEYFEPPSFMTLVEPGGGGDQKVATSHVQMVQKPPQPETSSTQSGWFPSLTHVVNESQGRKKNEQIIAKVTNWNTGRQHAPLKTLLSEAKAETKPKSPNLKENLGIAATQMDEMATTTSVVGYNQPITKPAVKSETGKESNSLADGKGEKKVKGRPYWVQFVCCSSVGSEA